MKTLLRFFRVMLTVALFPVMLQAEDTAIDSGAGQLEQVSKNMSRELLMDTAVDWNRYTKIKLEKATVEFRKNWERDQRSRTGNRPRERDIERIKTELSDLLNEVFIRKVAENGAYSLTDVAGEDVLLLTPAIIDLNINAPDRMRTSIGYSLTDSTGSMTLLLEIRDSVSGALLAKARDRREDPRKGYLEWTTSGTNRRSAELMLVRWTNGVLGWLEQARTESAQESR